MSDSDSPAAEAPTKTPTKSPKKKVKKAKTPSNHPKYSDMIRAAVTHLKERGGSSRQAILKYIVKSYNVGKDEKVVNQHLKMSLRAGVKNGSLKQSKGTGASGSFRIGDAKVSKPKVKKASPAKKPKKAGEKKVKKPKKTGEKKTKKPKKTAEKKPKKVKKAGEKKPKSPKKSKATKDKKPKAAKKSPKKAKK